MTNFIELKFNDDRSVCIKTDEIVEFVAKQIFSDFDIAMDVGNTEKTLKEVAFISIHRKSIPTPLKFFYLAKEIDLFREHKQILMSII